MNVPTRTPIGFTMPIMDARPVLDHPLVVVKLKSVSYTVPRGAKTCIRSERYFFTPDIKHSPITG
jgi:hypothetical protein